MELIAYSIGGTALALALFLAFTGNRSQRDRAIRFAIPAPLYVGAPGCGLILHHHHDMQLALGIANVAVLLAAMALTVLVVLVGLLSARK